MGDYTMAVNLAARVWAPYRELNDIVEAAVTRKQPGIAHDLEVALRKNRPDLISLLKRPAKNASHRELVKKSTVEGIAVQGEQRMQVFSQQFVAEALILSDLFDLNELAAVELLMAGEVQLPNYPGLTRGLVAVLLFYDGQRNLVTALRTLAQAREGRTWTVGVTQEIKVLIKALIDELLQTGIVGTILDLISSMDLVKEVDKLQKDRALGPPKHRKQVTDLFIEIRQTLSDIIFCLACQRPLSKQDTLRLMAHLRQDNSFNADQTLDSVSLCLLVALWYCFDVSLVQREDSEEVLNQLPVFGDRTYVQEIHQQLMSDVPWVSSGLKAAALFSWAIMLRSTSQFNLSSGGQNCGNDYFEDDEKVLDKALEGNVFSFLSTSVVSCPNFHSEEFYLRRLHGLVTDFICQMPLKIKELRNRGDEICRIILAHRAEGLEVPAQRRDFHEFLILIGDLYLKDPLKLQLALDYWCPTEPSAGNLDMTPVHRLDPRQLALSKFVRTTGDLLPTPLFLPYVHMLMGLATGPQASFQCFNLLRVNGNQSSPASWDHIFHSFNQYFNSLRQESYSISDSWNKPYRQMAPRSMTLQEQEAITAVLKLVRHIADQNAVCRTMFCETQQWAVVFVLFGLLSCNVSIHIKGEILCTLASIAQTTSFAALVWQTLEVSQVLPAGTTAQERARGIRVELEEVESRIEEYPMTRGFLELIGSLTQFPIPKNLGAGIRAPGFDIYLDFILNSVLLKFNTRAYKMAEEKWQVVSGCLEILVRLLSDTELQMEDLQSQTLGPHSAMGQPGFTILCLMLTDSQLYKTIQQILEEAISLFELFTPFPGREHLERASLLCLQLLVETFNRQDVLEQRIRDSASPILVSSLERLLLAINPRTRKADYLVNITKFVMFNTFLPKHTLAALRILCHVCEETPSQTDIVNLFTADKRVGAELLHGFVECLDSNCPEVKQETVSFLVNPEDCSEASDSVVENDICEQIFNMMLVSLDLPSPNLTHWLLGFQLQKPVSSTALQDPGVLDSPKTCLHSVLSLLEKGLGSREGPQCLLAQPRLAELGFQLIHVLCSNKDTSSPTLRYLRTTHDFLYQYLLYLPLDYRKYGNDLSVHQAWILKTVAIELRITSLNRQRSHTQRLVKLLLGEEGGSDVTDDAEMTAGIGERGSALSISRSHIGLTAGKNMRHRLLGVLDTISFEQSFPDPVQFTFFDKAKVESLVRSLEQKTRDGLAYCDVQALRQELVAELNRQQGPMVSGQKPHISEEIRMILETVVRFNEAREAQHRKKGAFEAWRHVVEVLLTSVPQDLLSGERRQTLLFELLQELLLKVSEEVNLEITSSVSDVLLTLINNLHHGFLLASSPTVPQNTDSSSHPFWFAKGSNSFSASSSSLQVVLQGLVDYILKSSGAVQKVRVNLYGALLYCLQIAQRPAKSDDYLSAAATSKSGVEKILSDDGTEFERLAAEYMNTIASYGESFMEAVCRDACDGHHIGRMMALSVLDTIFSMDYQHIWLQFLSGRGYLHHLINSVTSEDDGQLVATLATQPDSLRALYIFQSKMSLLTRIAESPEGARVLLHSEALLKLTECSVLSLRPEVYDQSQPSEEDDDDLLPSPLSRYRFILFSVLRFCLATLTSLGGENQEAATQVMIFVTFHGDVFSSILRSRKATLVTASLRELALTTALIARANYHSNLSFDLMEQNTQNMEFRAHRMRLQDQMLALLLHYSTPETFVKQLRSRITSPGRVATQADHDRLAELVRLYLEITASLTAYCRNLIANIGSGNLNQCLLFGPSLDEVFLHDKSRLDELSVALGTGRRLGLGVAVLLMDQSARQFSQVLESHQQLAQKLNSLSELTVEDLKQLCRDATFEKLSSQQRQELAKSRLVHLLSQKTQELQHYVYIVENCLYITWRHLEFYLVHCVPADQSTMTKPTFFRHQTSIRKLTGTTEVSLAEVGVPGSPALADGVSQVALGVSRNDIENLRSSAPTVLNDAFFKKIQHVDQAYGKLRTHYSFSEAIVRRIKRVLKLHTGV